MLRQGKIKKIVVTGPESTGKTTLSKELSQYFKSDYISEYAREYVEALDNKYDFNDVINIAKYQIQKFEEYNNYKNNEFVIFDTGLIITKVWFKEVFKQVPEFLTTYLKNLKIDFSLLCYPDTTWIPDNVRENGGKKRIELYNNYKYELDYYNFRYEVIKGDKNTRFQSAKNYLSSAYCLHNNH